MSPRPNISLARLFKLESNEREPRVSSIDFCTASIPRASHRGHKFAQFESTPGYATTRYREVVLTETHAN
jgi:hypothetical protein